MEIKLKNGGSVTGSGDKEPFRSFAGDNFAAIKRHAADLAAMLDEIGAGFEPGPMTGQRILMEDASRRARPWHGWYNLADGMPPLDDLVEIGRVKFAEDSASYYVETWPEPVRRRDIDPATNVRFLIWRPAPKPLDTPP